MEFGDRNSFAVELELDKDYGGAWLYGKFCYWIGGSRIGDYDQGTSLRDVLSQMKWAVYDCGNRDGGRLCSLDSDEAYRFLRGSLYGADEPQSGFESDLIDTPARFDISIPVDALSQWKIFLFECAGEATVLFNDIDDLKINVFVMPTGAFDRAIKASQEYLEALYDKEIANEEIG